MSGPAGPTLAQGQRLKLSRELMVRLSMAMESRGQPAAQAPVCHGHGHHSQRALVRGGPDDDTTSRRVARRRTGEEPRGKLSKIDDVDAAEAEAEAAKAKGEPASGFTADRKCHALAGELQARGEPFTGGWCRPESQVQLRRRAGGWRRQDTSSSQRRRRQDEQVESIGGKENRNDKGSVIRGRGRRQEAAGPAHRRPCDTQARGGRRRRGPLAAGLALLLLVLTLWRRAAEGAPQSMPATPPSSEDLSKAIEATFSTASPAGPEPAAAPAGNGTATNQPAGADLWTPLLSVGGIFIMGAIIVGDICGNSLVILSVCRHTKLRVTTNWFVVSLACADILVALFAMTFNASVIISGRWLFDRWVCDFWNSCDVLASTASILHLCFISIDRYIAIMRPLDYPMKITTKRVMYILCGVWIGSALVSTIPIFTGIYTTREHELWRDLHPDQCEFVVNRVYAIISSSVSFWIPSSIMVFTYYKIYREASRQEKFIYKAQSMMPAPMANHHHAHHGNGNNSNSHAQRKGRSKSVAVASLGGQRARQQQQQARGPRVATTGLDYSGLCPAPEPPAAKGAAPASASGEQRDSGPSDRLAEPAGASARAASMQQIGEPAEPRVGVAFEQTGEAALPLTRLPAPMIEADLLAGEPDGDDSNSGQSTPTKRSISKMKREHKAAKTLGIIMGVFILCWLPFFCWYTPMNICGERCGEMVPKWIITVLFWIGYFNSTLNPIIYAYFNHEFRDAFKKTLQWIFCCCEDLKCLRVNRPNDNQHYNCTYRSTQEIGLVSNG